MVHREENFASGVKFVKKKKAGMASVYGLLVIIVKDIREEKSTVGCGHCRPRGHVLSVWIVGN